MGFNVVVLSGRLTADPEIRMGTNDTKIARYTLAVDREKRKNTERKADFIPCVALGKNAEFVEKFLKKRNESKCAWRMADWKLYEPKRRKSIHK